MLPPDTRGSHRRPGRLRGFVDAMASASVDEQVADAGDSDVNAETSGGTRMGSARRTRFAPTVPAERRSRQRAVTEDTSEPQLPQHLQRLVKQAQLEGKVVRPREPVQGLERRQRRGEKAAHSHTETSEQINLSANDDISKGNLGTSQPGRVNAEVLTRTRGEGTSAQAKREVDEPRSLYGLPEFDSEIDGARTLNLDWTDDSQYYPTVLSAADEGATAATTASSVREALADTEQGQYLVIQLPTKLSLSNSGDRGKPDMDEYVQQCDGGEATGLSRLDEGQLGELCVHKDGSVKLHLGEAVFDVLPGTGFTHDEQLVCIDSTRGGKCAFLGQVPGRLVCIPDVAELLKVSQ